MDNDTIFPALSSGEIVVGKYEGRECSRSTKAIVIVTNFRLLIRWKGINCGCIHRSSYSSIILDSIDCIDYIRFDEKLPIVSALMLLVGLPLILYGCVLEPKGALAGCIIITTFAVIILSFSWYSKNKKFIRFKGTFGFETIIFEKGIAREFAGQLSEMIHQRRNRYFIEQNENKGSHLLYQNH
ncbi:hypothetical protein I4U23_021869 [Adineta vaga]|nr:hypothetical protein I4U23_021869 [Adineta vaga]